MVKTVSKNARKLVTIVIKHQENVRTAAKQAGKALFVKSVLIIDEFMLVNTFHLCIIFGLKICSSVASNIPLIEKILKNEIY